MPSDSRNAVATPHASPEASGRGSGGELNAVRFELSCLAARVAELERENARLERFVAVAAHEMSEPLVMTGAYASTLLERLGARADPASRSDLEALLRAVARMRLLVETLLQDARSEASLTREVVDLSRVVEAGLDLLGHEIRSRRTRIAVGWLPSVSGEPLLLATVMRNLLSNALRYGSRNGGTIRVSASQAGSLWRISVESEGTPITPEDRQRIFLPFERGRDERRSKGVGLGLAISRQIVERHGGTLGVESCPGGNRFYFTIPG
jgi:signal transduction histidine kinase